MFLSKDLWPRLSGRQVAQSVERRTLKQKSRVRNTCWAPGGGVGFHLTSPIRRAVRRRRPHYSQSGDPQFPGKKGLKMRYIAMIAILRLQIGALKECCGTTSILQVWLHLVYSLSLFRQGLREVATRTQSLSKGILYDRIAFAALCGWRVVGLRSLKIVDEGNGKAFFFFFWKIIIREISIDYLSCPVGKTVPGQKQLAYK